MTRLDQFESVFRAASKPQFVVDEPIFDRALLVHDLTGSGRTEWENAVKGWVEVLLSHQSVKWQSCGPDDFDDLQQLLGQVEEKRPDLICTYRHLKSSGWQWPHSLGEYLDVLTQATDTPVLVLPHPEGERAAEHIYQNSDRVMVLTDQLTHDSRLVNFGAMATERGGKLVLAHVEHGAIFDRYMEVISKLPSIDTETAESDIRERLLSEPRDFIETCRRALRAAERDIEVVEEVRVGKHVADMKWLVEKYEVDLLLMNTKEADQLAMHGIAYAVAVETRSIPILML